MIAEIVESLIGLVEFAIEAAAIPLRRPDRGPRVGDRFRTTRRSSVTAVFRPLTGKSERIEVQLPPGLRCRVELAVPGAGHAIYLACRDPVERLQLAPTDHRRALASGLWLEVSPALLKSHFESLRTLGGALS